MLLLVTILLVLIAAVTLLIGIFSDNLALIFISIGASALAAIVLAVLSQVSKRKGREATPSTGPEPLPVREPSTVGGGRETAEQAADDIATIGEPVSVASSDAPTTAMSAVGALPIANYDNLRVNEILPLLDALDLDQLEAVAQHEENNKNRTTVLNRIDDLMDELEARESGATTAGVDLTDDDDVAAAAVESIEAVGEPVVSSAGASSGGFPIPDYDDLDEDELIELLEDLDADQLETVADREEAGPNRDAVLDAIDDRLDILEGIVAAPPAKASVKSAKKAAAKKAPAKKATPPSATRKATAPTSVKKAAAKKSPAPAKKAAAPAKKTATRATAAKKSPAKKATSTTAKATKKASPAKKATAAKKTTKKTTKR